MKKTVCIVLTIISIAALLAGCSKAKPHVHNDTYEWVIKGDILVSFPGASEEQKAAMNAYVEDFKKAYPKVNVFVEYPEVLSEEDLFNSVLGILDVLVLPEDQVYRCAAELITLMPLEYYGKAFGVDIENMYDGVENGMVGSHLYYIRMPQFSDSSGDGIPVGLAVYNRTQKPDAAAAFALFFYTPEVPKDGIWTYTEQKIID